MMIFLDEQHQALLILKGNLFDTFSVVLAGNLPKRQNPVFAERPVGSCCFIFTFSQLERPFVKVIQ